MMLKYYGLRDLTGLLRVKTSVGITGTSLFNLTQTLKYFGFDAECYDLSLKKLRQKTLPAIVHLDNKHFAVVYKITDRYVYLADPAIGKIKLRHSDFTLKWKGVTLVASILENQNLHKVREIANNYQTKLKQVRKEFYWNTLKSFLPILGVLLLLSFLLQLLAMVLPFFTQNIIDVVLPNNDVDWLTTLILSLLFAIILIIVLSHLRNQIVAKASVRFEFVFFKKLFEHLIQLKQSYFDAHRKEDLLQRFEENLKIRGGFSTNVLQSIMDLIFVVNFVVVMFIYQAHLAAWALGFIVLSLITTVFFVPKMRALEYQVYQQNVLTTESLLDALQGIQNLKLLNAEQIKLRQWSNLYGEALDPIRQSIQTRNLLDLIFRSIILFGQIVIYGYGANLVIQHNLQVGEYVAFVTIFTIATFSLDRVSSLWYLIMDLSIAYDRLNDTFMQPKDNRVGTCELEALTEESRRPQITIKDLQFAYGLSSQEYSLENISLSISYGQKIGIVGRNGSGKTTLVKLLAGLYTHYSGVLQVNGVEIRDIPSTQLRQVIAVVPQEVYLFSGTIRENMLMANPDASDDEIYAALKLADMQDYIEQCYAGLDQLLIQNGANLSHGQRRKLAFARLFISRADIVILDEASSALDIETERRILSHLKSHFPRQTIISVAHRLYTVKNADKIVVLDNGKIVEQGKHEELMAGKGFYFTFVTTYLDH